MTILLSILLHAAVFYLLSKSKRKEDSQTKVEIEYRETPKSQGKGKRGTKKKGKGISLADLRPSWTTVTEPGPNTGRLIDPDAKGSSEWPEGSWGANGIKLGELEHFIQYERIQKDIQGLFFFPSALGKKDISGTINARLYFTETSECNWSKSTISGANPFLKFYIAAVLKKYCRFENGKHLRLKQDQFIDLSFAFILAKGESREESESKDRILGNVLMFTRIHHKATGDYQIGPIRGNILVPIAVTVDFPWLLEKWDEVMNHRDPLDEFRD